MDGGGMDEWCGCHWGTDATPLAVLQPTFPSHSLASLLLAMGFFSSASTREVLFEWFTRKSCDHQGVYWTIFSHCSGCYFTEVKDWAGCNLTTVFPLWLSFISSQLTNVYWLSSVHVHYCTWLNKIFITTLWLDFYCSPNLHVRELSYITSKRSGQASDKDHFWTSSLWVYRLWLAAVLPATLEVSVHYLLSVRNELNKMSPKFGFLLLSWKINTSSL